MANIKLTKIADKCYNVELNGIMYHIRPDNYSYYLQYDLTAFFPDGRCIDYGREFMPNLQSVKDFIIANT